MPLPLRPAADAASAVIIKTILFAVSLVPPVIAYAGARVLGLVLHASCSRWRRIALRNLDIAFRSTLTPAEKRRIARRAFQHATSSFLGLVLRGRWARASRRQRVYRISREEEDLVDSPHPHGVALLSAHLGDWEMGHHWLCLKGLRAAAVTRSIPHGPLDRELVRLREAQGGRVVTKRGALREVRRLVGEGGVVAIVADQNCPRRERFFDFFGVPASAYTEHARLLVRTGTRIVFGACLRQGFRMRFRIVLRDLTRDLPSFEDAPSAERRRLQADEVVRRYMEALEELVRSHPEQYLWMHRRWKSRPDGAPWLYGDLEKALPEGVLGGVAIETR